MRVGLLRHFPAEEKLPQGWRKAAELDAWRRKYDESPAIIGTADLGRLQWDECITSDLGRTLATANAVFAGPIEKTALLREPQFAPFQTGNLRLPIWLWRWVLRLSWMSGHRSQRASRDEFRQRIKAVAAILEAKSWDVLVVSHAGMMAYLSAELRRRGFVGPKLRIPEHATLYVYERAPAGGAPSARAS